MNTMLGLIDIFRYWPITMDYGGLYATQVSPRWTCKLGEIIALTDWSLTKVKYWVISFSSWFWNIYLNVATQYGSEPPKSDQNPQVPIYVQNGIFLYIIYNSIFMLDSWSHSIKQKTLTFALPVGQWRQNKFSFNKGSALKLLWPPFTNHKS